MCKKNVKLPKIPIDCSKAGTGEAPFDGKCCLLHLWNGAIVSGLYITEPSDDDIEDGLAWVDEFLVTYPINSVTHYTPMPEFYEPKGGDK